ncbi:MAG: AraC family transcriptional regulator [Anaerolineales bacterium]|nr:AraC family transcriptional regulator [Anaerolineales bacterium]
MRPLTNQSRFWRYAELDLRLLQAFYLDFAYPRHSHDHYVICVIEHGAQSFTYRGSKLYTPPNGLILLNPDEVHTGEPASESGFQLRALYPTVAQLSAVARELTGRSNAIPYFRHARVDDPVARQSLLRLHELLKSEGDPLRAESQFLSTMSLLISRYADIRLDAGPAGPERRLIRCARHFLEENYAEPIRLADLAEQVNLSPYHLLRVFQQEIGMPPHAYLQNVRVHRAQRLIDAGQPLAEVALAVGFSSQSHLTRRFKETIGLTPGRYAAQVWAAPEANI